MWLLTLLLIGAALLAGYALRGTAERRRRAVESAARRMTEREARARGVAELEACAVCGEYGPAPRAACGREGCPHGQA